MWRFRAAGRADPLCRRRVPPQIVFVPARGRVSTAWMPVIVDVRPVDFAVRDDGPDRGRDGPARGGDVPLRRGDGRTRRCRRVRRNGVAVDAAGRVPFGGESYSFVSTISGNGVCSQSVRIISRGDGTKPVVERHSSGNCGAAALMPAEAESGGAAGRSGAGDGAEAARSDPDRRAAAAAAPMPGWPGRSPRCVDRPRPGPGPDRAPHQSRSAVEASGSASMPRATASSRRSPPCSPTIISPTGVSPGCWIGTVAAQRSRKLIAEQLRRISALSRR